jgi:hypothetical protein
MLAGCIPGILPPLGARRRSRYYSENEISDALDHLDYDGRFTLAGHVKRMNKEEARELLERNGFDVTEEPLPNGYGVQLRTAQGPMVIVYNSGKCVPGGKNPHLMAPRSRRTGGRLRI